MKNKVFNIVIKFMEDNQITCEETIYQSDKVIENAYEFISELFKIVENQIKELQYECDLCGQEYANLPEVCICGGTDCFIKFK